MKYIGHLDIMRYFQKAIRRAGIDIRYTEGFSPHMVMSFAAPLGVGMISDGEYLDIEVHSSASSRESVAALNREMTEGMEIVSWVSLPDDAKKAMSLVAAADYLYTRRADAPPSACMDEMADRIRQYYAERSHIEVVKKTKKSERTLDIRPLIYDMHPVTEGDRAAVFFRLCSGSTDNIKPELVLEDYFQYFGESFDPLDFERKRLEVYGRDGEELKPLSAFGAELS